ncbi:MAG TPA: MaoC family dehydratase N-terminal domain-containing protein [Acidimicrobiales bacterium]|jgi:acyl dehydratase|nr:MaoC family dehydratase N-terminal domain-containing protein [Acidimicrobiales bacterium]
MADEGLIKGRITDESVEMMRKRIGYPNPTVRSGIVTLPWNTACTPDGIRHFVEGYGDANPLFVDPAYGPRTRWGTQIAPPGFEATMGYDRSPVVPDDLARETRGALRGVQLFHSGNDSRFFRPVIPGDVLDRTQVVAHVEDKQSEFAGRSVIVTNLLSWVNQRGEVVSDQRKWFVHAERRAVSDRDPSAPRPPRDEPASYTDEQLAEIEAAYDAEYCRGDDTLWFEDVDIGATLPTMVKGPLTVTDLINMHMGGGWFGYGNPPLRLAYENRKKLRGFYTKDEFGSWDVVQRVHWDAQLARKVGVPAAYDIGPMRWAWLQHYCTNWCGDDGWLFRVRGEFRKFNYMGDTTWITARITDARIDAALGPLVDLEITGTNQRGRQNINGRATILVASREHGPVRLPDPPPTPEGLRQ